MELAIPRFEFTRLIETQLRSLFLLDNEHDVAVVHASLEEALERAAHSFESVDNKYYRREEAVFFSPFHGAQYSVFLYYLANTVWRANVKNSLIADRIYCLNRALNGVDLYYEIDLPSVFACDHPLGSVMGRARFGNYFFFTQNCTVGNNKGIYPILGDYVTMLPGSTILGKSRIGHHVIMAAHSYVRDLDVPPYSLVFGREKELVIKPIAPDLFPGNIAPKWVNEK